MVFPLLGWPPADPVTAAGPTVGSLGGFLAPRLRPPLGLTTSEGDTTLLMKLQGNLFANLTQEGTKLDD